MGKQRYSTFEPCVACGVITPPVFIDGEEVGGNCEHHLTSRGSQNLPPGVELESPENKMPLCFLHHEEIHRSIGRMLDKYYFVSDWLIQNGRVDIIEKAKKAT